MSMLAEGRKKVKYSVNPRGTTWSNDEDKYGQKLMEKFGWQKGKGLGANEDGRVEHVKASGKINTKGFGFKNTDNTNWISHQDDFDSLLSELNANHGRGEQDDADKVINLEAQSKAAKKRVHYHKHAKGKDLSQRTSEDLNCIFGRKKSKQPKQKDSSADVQEKNVASPSEETTHGIQTIQSNQSVQEYFAMKMAKLKAKKNTDEQLSCPSDALQKEEIEPDESAEDLVSKETSAADSEAVAVDEETEEKSKKKKKKKKSKEKEREKEGEEENEDDCHCSPLRTEEKGKSDSNEDDDNAGENCDENLSKKTRKSKRKKRSKERSNNEAEETLQNVVNDEISVAEDVEVTPGETSCISESTKKKRNKKSKAAEDPEILENSTFSEKDATDADLGKISKKTTPSIDETKIAEVATGETSSTRESSKKKRNKKSKIDINLSNSNDAEDAKILENPTFSEKDATDVDLGRTSKTTTLSIDDETKIAENETPSKPKKNKKNKRKKDGVVENDIDNSVTFDMENSNSSNSSNVDNNDEEATVSPPKKKKKKSSKKSKSDEADESLDTQTADGSTGDKKKKYVEITDATEIDESSVMDTPYIPSNKYDVKRSVYAINTATETFQKAGANIDAICGYGYTRQ